MDHDTLDRYRAWFTRFVQEHTEPEVQHRRNILLKESHTQEVAANALRIAAELGLNGQETALAGAVALFHDAGRFPQYRRFRTFQDSISVNHAVLGAKVLLERQVLRDLPRRERSLIIRAVTLHNVFTLPPLADNDLRLHARIVRDADKLDIWRVFAEYFALPPADRPTAAGLGLPDSPELSPGVLASLGRREMVRLTSLRTLNDFRLLQLAWIYDLNFAPSLRMVRERGVIDRLSATLPPAPEVACALDSLRRYVDGQAQGP
jgi:putative nucleotidyltransferase with HDIG domain